MKQDEKLSMNYKGCYKSQMEKWIILVERSREPKENVEKKIKFGLSEEGAPRNNMQ